MQSTKSQTTFPITFRKRSLDSLAEQFYISKYYLSRSFHEVTGFGINEYINILRVKKRRAC